MKDLSHFSRSEISAIFSKARCLLRHTGLTLLCVPATKPTGRILVITSRKVGNAPQRNQIRRRIKAIFYEEQLLNRGFDVVAIIKKPGMDLSYDELKALIVAALAKTSAN